MKKKKINWSELAILVLTVALYFQIGRLYQITEIDFDSVCSQSQTPSLNNSSISEIAFNLSSWMKSFYNYTVREDTIKTLEDIKQNGGDCFDYANLYVLEAQKIGINGRVELIPTYGGDTHAFAILSNSKGYCILDADAVPSCYQYKNDTFIYS